MKKFFNKYFWTLLIVIAALGLAGSAAYFSISGLSKLFGGSAFEVIIMASFIEFGKLATTAALHRYWDKTKWWMKYTLTAMVMAVMLITSSGIYGFLAGAYSATSIELDKIEGKIELVEKQQEQKKTQIAGIDEIKDSKSNRIVTLNDLRVQQEARIDSLYNKGWYSSAKKTQALIDASTEEIQRLQIELDTIALKVNVINQEIGDLDISILDLQNSDIATEIGPLKYISTVLDKPMDDVINWFILMLIFVFDPLAVLLIIFASNIYDANNKNNDPPGEGKKSILGRLRDKLKKPESIVEEEPEVDSHPLIVDDEVDDEPKLTQEAKQQKIVDAINNVDEDSDILDFGHDFPEEKGEEVVEYVEDENGDFEKTDEPKKSFASILKGIESNPIYVNLLDILYGNGNRSVGDVIPPHKELVKEIQETGFVYDKKVVDSFLTVCNLLSITDMRDNKNVKITMEYEQAKNIISLVSK
jgi:hypothetical protein